MDHIIVQVPRSGANKRKNLLTSADMPPTAKFNTTAFRQNFDLIRSKMTSHSSSFDLNERSQWCGRGRSCNHILIIHVLFGVLESIYISLIPLPLILVFESFIIWDQSSSSCIQSSMSMKVLVSEAGSQTAILIGVTHNDWCIHALVLHCHVNLERWRQYCKFVHRVD